MKKVSVNIIVLSLIIGLILPSCQAIQNSNNTQKGTAIGATTGGALGTIIGNNIGRGNPALGLIIGAAVGGAAGGIIGNKMDKQATEISNALPGAQVERVGEGIRVVLGENSVNFNFNKADLTDQAKTNLSKLITVLNSEPDTNLQIQGYTDSKGSDEYNLKLSEQRAQAVYNYLVSHGISSSRLTTKGFGEANPIATNDTDEGRAQNRRVEFMIAANDQMKSDAEKQAKKDSLNRR